VALPLSVRATPKTHSTTPHPPGRKVLGSQAAVPRKLSRTTVRFWRFFGSCFVFQIPDEAHAALVSAQGFIEKFTFALGKFRAF
jgi:hypothetical protein